jgi:hypothetical protein
MFVNAWDNELRYWLGNLSFLQYLGEGSSFDYETERLR